jgi:hypothetical protein
MVPQDQRSTPVPKNSNKPWSYDEDERLLELKAARKSNGAIKSLIWLLRILHC